MVMLKGLSECAWAMIDHMDVRAVHSACYDTRMAATQSDFVGSSSSSSTPTVFFTCSTQLEMILCVSRTGVELLDFCLECVHA